MKHSVPWILWLILSMALGLSTRNPFYLSIQIIVLLGLGFQLARQKGRSKWLLFNIRFLGIMLLLSMIINALFSHQGRTVILEIPKSWILIGGAITVESLLYGLINGLVIGVLYIAFNIFNLALSIKQITRMIPKVFYPIALMITIALTFFPTIQRRANEIKEAQMIRGNQMKKVSDWLPIFLPLLVTSLENSFLLSESMTTRGFHTQQTKRTATNTIIGTIFAVFMIFSAWILHLFNYPILLSSLHYIAGGISLFLSFYLASREIKITRYYQEEWGKKDLIPAILLAFVVSSDVVLKSTHTLPPLIYSPLSRINIANTYHCGNPDLFNPGDSRVLYTRK